MVETPSKEQKPVATHEEWEPPVLKVIDVMEQTMKVGRSGPFDGGIKKS
ncbi:MAG: hypothetical protein ACPGOY_12355 [Rhodospirillaceae bacterium]